MTADADLILFNGKITTFDRQNPQAQAVAVRDRRFQAVGDDRRIVGLAGANMKRSAADYEDFQVERPETAPTMESDLELCAGAQRSVIASPLRSTLAINPTCRPFIDKTAPFSLVSTIAPAPAPIAAPAPAAP
jgi:hypothetical protein